MRLHGEINTVERVEKLAIPLVFLVLFAFVIKHKIL